MIIRRTSQHKRMPWANGGGSTTELWREEVDGDLRWRLSMANVDKSGPFSYFEGVDRIIGHLEGGAMRLQGPDIDVLLTPGTTFAFQGEMPIEATIAAPCLDFNLMLRRGEITGEFAFAQGGELAVGPAEAGFVFALDDVGIGAESLNRHDLALITAAETIAFAGRCIVGRIDFGTPFAA